MTSVDDDALDLNDDPDEEVAAASLGLGYIPDFISGKPVRGTPEELEAVQVISRRLVEDYGYPRALIQTRPQFRVRKAPSDTKKSYPVDLAVFRAPSRTENDAYILVECKRKSRKDGITQLKLYLDMSPAAELGIWFNGEDHEYLRKVVNTNGTRGWEVLPNIPRYGQAIEDIGKFRRQDLVRPSNLKAVFRDIRNHLAGNVTGITRDEPLAQEIINILFCKIYDELNTGKNEIVTFRAGHAEASDAVEKRLLGLFLHVKTEYNDVFSELDSITLDPASLVYVVGELQNYCIVEADRDAIGDAFEVFIGPALRGAEGQFFTPRNVVRMVVDVLDPEPGQMVIDPACGSGGFLIMMLEHVWSKLEQQAEAMGWSAVQLERKKRDAASRNFRGLEKDSFLAKVTKSYMAIIGDGRGGVFCENSLVSPDEWNMQTQDKVKLGSFDLVVTNPPFGSKIRVKGAGVLSQYDLGHKWKRDRHSGDMEKTEQLQKDQPPQLLFLERCLQMLSPRGRLGIVLPESILGNPSYRHVLRWLDDQGTVYFVATMPEALFKTSGKGGTHTKVAVLVVRKRSREELDAIQLMGPRSVADGDIFMADAKWCGHDSRGNPTLRPTDAGDLELLDDVPIIASHFRRYRSEGVESGTRLGFRLRRSSVESSILVPKYYDPELMADLTAMESTHDLPTIGDLVVSGHLLITTGVEVGKMAYGTGPVPFIRTSDISNWELKSDPKHGVSGDLHNALREKIDVAVGDILMVRDGTYLIGTCAMVTEFDLPMLYQSHILKLRLLHAEALD